MGGGPKGGEGGRGNPTVRLKGPPGTPRAPRYLLIPVFFEGMAPARGEGPLLVLPRPGGGAGGVVLPEGLAVCPGKRGSGGVVGSAMASDASPALPMWRTLWCARRWRVKRKPFCARSRGSGFQRQLLVSASCEM